MDLEGGKLDLAVAKALGLKVSPHPSTSGWWLVWNAPRGGWDTIMAEAPDAVDPTVWSPSTKWEHGGPIIEREGIAMLPDTRLGWLAMLLHPGRRIEQLGSTPLIAAMRAFAASKQSG